VISSALNYLSRWIKVYIFRPAERYEPKKKKKKKKKIMFVLINMYA